MKLNKNRECKNRNFCQMSNGEHVCGLACENPRENDFRGALKGLAFWIVVIVTAISFGEYYG